MRPRLSDNPDTPRVPMNNRCMTIYILLYAHGAYQRVAGDRISYDVSENSASDISLGTSCYPLPDSMVDRDRGSHPCEVVIHPHTAHTIYGDYPVYSLSPSRAWSDTSSRSDSSMTSTRGILAHMRGCGYSNNTPP